MRERIIGWFRRHPRLRALGLLLLAALLWWGGKTGYDRLTASETRWRAEMAAGDRAMGVDYDIVMRHYERAYREACKGRWADARRLESELKLGYRYYRNSCSAYPYPEALLPSLWESLRERGSLRTRVFRCQQACSEYRQAKLARTLCHTALQRAMRQRDYPSAVTAHCYLMQMEFHGQASLEIVESHLMHALALLETGHIPEDPEIADLICLTFVEGGSCPRLEPLEERAWLQAMRITEHHYGPVSLEVRSRLDELVKYYRRIGEHGKALSYTQRVFTINTAGVKQTDISYARSLRHLGLAYGMAGQYAEARQLFIQSLEIIAQKHSRESRRYTDWLVIIADCWQQCGRHTEALSLHEECIAIVTRMYGPDTSHVVNALYTYKEALLRAGQRSKAVAVDLQMRKIEKKIFRNLAPPPTRRVNHPSHQVNPTTREIKIQTINKHVLLVILPPDSCT